MLVQNRVMQFYWFLNMLFITTEYMALVICSYTMMQLDHLAVYQMGCILLKVYVKCLFMLFLLVHARLEIQFHILSLWFILQSILVHKFVISRSNCIPIFFTNISNKHHLVGYRQIHSNFCLLKYILPKRKELCQSIPLLRKE